jgi:hypothetical protein
MTASRQRSGARLGRGHTPGDARLFTAAAVLATAIADHFGSFGGI